ncbi:MAG: type II secretion system protein GspM [Hyphomonas sp.]|jgi:general secretion pathway protein M|nr:type II secretion system protein GspM [Hyphomonas sp.]
MNLYSLPRPRQQLVAGALALAAVLLAGLVVASPVAGMVHSRQEEIRKGEAELARWRGIAASSDIMSAAASDPAANVRAAALALPPSTDAQAAASVQAMVRRMLGDAGADLKSVQPLDSRAAGSLREAGVRVVAMATQKQLDDTLFALDNSNPRLFVREANFQLSSAVDPDGSKQAPVLQVRLDIYAYALPETGE